MKNKHLNKLTAAFFVFSSAVMANATGGTYDPALDFSATDNPNGVWSYGWSIALGTEFNRDTEFGAFEFQGINYPGLDSWARNNVTLPIVMHNGTLEPISIIRSGGPSLVFAPGELSLHPGLDNSYSVLRWTAPNSGNFEVKSVFEGLEPLGATTDVHVQINGTSIYDGYVNGYGDNTQQPFLGAFTLAAGDTVDFAVGAGGNGYIADSTALVATIAAIPIPGTFWLFGAGLVGMVSRSIKTQK